MPWALLPVPEAFSAPFAKRLDGISAMSVCEATDGQQILPGHVYVAPGDRHLEARRNGTRYVCQLDGGDPVNRHRPSVDVPFRSVAAHVAANAAGVILAGTGNDGAQGMKEMHEAGAYTLAQDQATSVVWGMPRRACELGAVSRELPLHRIGEEVLRHGAAHGYPVRPESGRSEVRKEIACPVDTSGDEPRAVRPACGWISRVCE